MISFRDLLICTFIVIDVMQISVSQSRNLCDLCECLPSHYEPSYVNCNCKKNKVLILKDEDSEMLSITKVLNISTCNFVSFPGNGFQKSKKLKSLQIRQMNLFHLNSGVFPSVSNLAIEDVSELIIDGFQGQSNLVNIEIKNSVLAEITEDSFKDLKNLERLVFHNVSITTIDTAALQILSNTPKLSVKFVNCKIDTIQSESISMQVAKLEIIGTAINVINPEAMNVSATDSIDIIRSTFGAILSPESFKFRSNKINFVENEFKSLPSSLLKDVHATADKKINFNGNIIHDIDLGGFLLNSKTEKLNFVKNKIVCDCTPRKMSLLRLKELFPGLLTNETNFDAIIENNSCKNYNGIHLSEFKRKFLSGLMCNETDMKMLETYSGEQTEQFVNWQSTTEKSENKSSSLTAYYSLIFVCILLRYF